MKHDLRLPQSSKEGLLYGMIICGITAFLMTFLNIYLQFYTVNKEVLFIILKAFPLFFIVAMLLENFVISRFANKLVENIQQLKIALTLTFSFPSSLLWLECRFV
ncbi:hypothetical protein BN1423_1340024 [Carnobacterium maltaromaticum]|nr:hypothetical protein BN1423_1340024 [Carnobacterium maltaromaticum]